MIKSNKSRILLFSFIVLIGISCAEDPKEDFSLAKQELEVEYGNDPLQTYDLYLPADRSSATTDVIILVHGGGWVGGDKDDVFGIVELLQTTMPEYAIVNLNYRLDIDPDDLFGDHLADVESVVTEIADRSENIGVSKRMIMAGVSAGGHMTLQYSYTQNTNDYIKVAGNIVGPTYFQDPAYTMSTVPSHLATIGAIVSFTGIPISQEAYYDSVSPFKAVSSSSIPTIQFHGDSDPLIPVSQGTLLKEALDQAGVPNELIIYEGEGHGWTNPDNWTDTAIRFRDFVEQHL